MLTLRCDAARFSGVLAMPLLLLLANSAAAQADATAQQIQITPAAPKTSPSNADMLEQLSALASQVRTQSAKLGELTAIVAEQQRVINELLARSEGRSQVGAAAEAAEAGTPRMVNT